MKKVLAQRAAIWWTENVSILLSISFALMGVIVIYVAIANVRRLNVRDTNNLNPMPLSAQMIRELHEPKSGIDWNKEICAPASLNGKTIINCVSK